MRDLTDLEKIEVKKMYESAWFKIMKSLVKDFEYDIFKSVRNSIQKSGSINSDVQEVFVQQNNKLLWVEMFISKVKTSTSWVGKKEK